MALSYTAEIGLATDKAGKPKGIWAKTPYLNGRGRDMAHEVAGGRWDKVAKVWRYPLTMSTCRELRRVWGESLRVSSQLSDWARGEIAREAELDRLRLPDSGAPVPLPFLDGHLPGFAAALRSRPYQANGVGFLRTGRRVILGDEPGLGKTYQALGAVAEERLGRVLIVAPKVALVSVWEKHIRSLLGDYGAAYVAGGDLNRADREEVIDSFNGAVEEPAGYALFKTRFLIVNPEMIRVVREWICPDGTVTKKLPGRSGGCGDNHKHKTAFRPEFPGLFLYPYDAIILDESHRALASTSNKQSANISQTRLGAVRLPVRDNSFIFALSGTPFRSHLERSWGTLNMLRPDQFSSYWRFAESHFKIVDNGFGKVIGQAYTLDGPGSDLKLTETLRPYYLARTKADAAPDLPPITFAGTAPETGDGYPGIYLPMDDRQAKAYADMVNFASANLADGQINATGILAEITRRKQFACSYMKASGEDWRPSLPSNKLDWILQFAEERRETGAKYIIASQFTALIDLFALEVANYLRSGNHQIVDSITGATSARRRDSIQERFQDPSSDLKVVFLNLHAGGEAITLDQADEMVVIDEAWSADAMKQLYSRIHRVSRIHPVTIYNLRSIDTIDEDIANLTATQRAELEKVSPDTVRMVLR